MNNFLASAAMAVVASLLGALISYYISHRVQNTAKTRKIITKSKSGKINVIFVPPRISDSDFNSYVVKSIKSERDIAEQVKDLERTVRNLRVHKGKFVDLIAAHEGSKVAIEVKANLDHVDMRMIRRYMKDEEGIKKLFLVSTDPASSKILNEANDLVSSGRISILNIDPTSSSDGDRLNAAVREALHVPQA